MTKDLEQMAAYRDYMANYEFKFSAPHPTKTKVRKEDKKLPDRLNFKVDCAESTSVSTDPDNTDHEFAELAPGNEMGVPVLHTVIP